MPTYEVVCESCDAEYSVTSLDGINIDPPAHCSYCGEALNDDLIKEYDEDEDDWDKLSEEGLDDIDDWKD